MRKACIVLALTLAVGVCVAAQNASWSSLVGNWINVLSPDVSILSCTISGLTPKSLEVEFTAPVSPAEWGPYELHVFADSAGDTENAIGIAIGSSQYVERIFVIKLLNPGYIPLLCIDVYTVLIDGSDRANTHLTHIFHRDSQ